MQNLRSTISTALEEFWAMQTIDAGGATSVDELVAAMDSVTACEVLAAIESIVGMELPSGSVIKRGGYDSKDEFVAVLTQKILDYVAEHKK